jgi:hypothetical protein
METFLDPSFRRTRTMFDEASVKGLLLNNLVIDN